VREATPFPDAICRAQNQTYSLRRDIHFKVKCADAIHRHGDAIDCLSEFETIDAMKQFKERQSVAALVFLEMTDEMQRRFDGNSGILVRASWTLLSPKSKCPASIASRTVSAE
jgi:hypothetical protein